MKYADLTTEDAPAPTPIEFSHVAYSKVGAGRTSDYSPRIRSFGFGPCIGMIVQDTQSDTAYGFHFYRGTVTKGHVDAFKKLAESGREYRACFMRGNKGFDPETVQDHDVGSGSNQRSDASLKQIIEEHAPAIRWRPTIETGRDQWSFDYNAKTRVLAILSKGMEPTPIDNPLGLEPLKWAERTGMGPGESMAWSK